MHQKCVGQNPHAFRAKQTHNPLLPGAMVSVANIDGVAWLSFTDRRRANPIFVRIQSRAWESYSNPLLGMGDVAPELYALERSIYGANVPNMTTEMPNDDNDHGEGADVGDDWYVDPGETLPPGEGKMPTAKLVSVADRERLEEEKQSRKRSKHAMRAREVEDARR